MNKEEFEVARAFLNSVSEKPESSSIANNRIADKEYDVTIIIPCYNEEKYIGQCLDSVLNQKTDYKIKTIIINDGSTDGTAEILKNYADAPGFQIINQDNRGFSGARNTGLELINSRYIMFLDSDDYLVDNSLDGMIKAADEYKADIVEAQMLNLVDGELLRGENAFEYTGEVNPGELSGYVWGKVIVSELFENLKFPENYWYEDTIMTFLVYTRCKKAIKYNQDLYVYRRNPDGITAMSRGKDKAVDTYWITELMIFEMEKLGIRFNQEIYEKLLHQIALNYVRTNELPENVNLAIFMLTVEWFRELDKAFLVTDKFQAILEKAIRVEDYNLYKQACILLWQKNLLGS